MMTEPPEAKYFTSVNRIYAEFDIFGVDPDSLREFFERKSQEVVAEVCSGILTPFINFYVLLSLYEVKLKEEILTYSLPNDNFLDLSSYMQESCIPTMGLVNLFRLNLLTAISDHISDYLSKNNPDVKKEELVKLFTTELTVVVDECPDIGESILQQTLEGISNSFNCPNHII